ncbi:MAG TPA: phosphoribosyltransferase family protein [Catenuloplanes sp.]
MDDNLRGRLITTFRWVDPGPHCDHLVSDRSGWWRDPLVLAALGPALAALFPDEQPTVVVAPEVTGFLVGPLVAAALGVGFVEAYKDGREQRIAEPVTWAAAAADYRGRELRLGVRGRHLRTGDRVLLVDDWVASGAQSRALGEVVATLGARTIGTAAIVADCPATVAAEVSVRALLTGADLAT